MRGLSLITAVLLAAGLVSCTKPEPSPADVLKYMDAPSASAFSKEIIDAGIFKGSVITAQNGTTVSTDPLETYLFKQSYENYCTHKGGTFVGRYIPTGPSSTIAEGYKNQAVFFHDSKIGRTEFQFCTVSNKPGFAYAHVTATDLLILEGKELDIYVKNQMSIVQKAANEAAATGAFYESDASSAAQGYTLIKAILTLNKRQPEITADFKNTNGGDVYAEVAIPAGIMADTERYLLVPAYRGGDALDVTTRGTGCSLNKERTVLTLNPGAVCKTTIRYSPDAAAVKIKSKQTTLFLAGHAANMHWVSELDSKNSELWLKPRLAKVR